MVNKKIQHTFFLLGISLLVFSGCGKQKPVVPVPTASSVVENKIAFFQDEALILNDQPQNAVFYLLEKKDKNGQKFVVMDVQTKDSKKWDGKEILAPTIIADHAAQGLKMNACIKGLPAIRVSARIQMTGSPDTFHTMNLLDLTSMDIQADPC